ncbi:hypothetical protein GF314_16675, partial [bacterium]|nr:hypothetical protein [bacterium]
MSRPASERRRSPSIRDVPLALALLALTILIHLATTTDLALGWLAIPAIAAAVTAARAGGARRWLLVGLLAAQAALAVWPLLADRESDEQWQARQEDLARDRLDAEVRTLHAQRAALERFIDDQTADLDADSLARRDPFVLCAEWQRRWRQLRGTAAQRDLAVVIWRGDQRLGWAGPLIPGDHAPDPDASELIHDSRAWARRALSRPDAAGGYLIECQLWLASVGRDGDDAGERSGRVERRIVHDARAPGARTWGDAERGLRLAEDVVLGAPDRHGVRPRLRLSIDVPPRQLQSGRQRAGLILSQVLLVGVAWLLAVGDRRGLGGLVATAWPVRAWWASVDVVRLLAVALPSERLPADPASPASLLDPAYFATTLGGGWFASGADALLTAALIGGAAVWAWRRHGPVRREIRPRLTRGLLAIPLAIGAFVLLRWLWSDLAANANARLIGLQVPLTAWTFWALHAVILAISLALAAMVVLVALRLLGTVPPRLRGPARPAWLVAGLLVIVGVNYAALATAYGAAERDWLRRKADQIVQPQDELVAFLIDDVLTEMRAHDTGIEDPAQVGPGR